MLQIAPITMRQEHELTLSIVKHRKLPNTLQVEIISSRHIFFDFAKRTRRSKAINRVSFVEDAPSSYSACTSSMTEIC